MMVPDLSIYGRLLIQALLVLMLLGCSRIDLPTPATQPLPTPQIIGMSEEGKVEINWGWWLTGQEQRDAQDNWEVLLYMSDSDPLDLQFAERIPAASGRMTLEDLVAGQLYYFTVFLTDGKDSLPSNIIACTPSKQPTLKVVFADRDRPARNGTWSGSSQIMFERITLPDSLIRIYEYDLQTQTEKLVATGAEPDWNVTTEKLAYRTLIDPSLPRAATVINTLNPRSGGGVDATLGGDRLYVQPDWAADGEALVCLALRDGADTYEIVRYNPQGGSLPFPLTQGAVAYQAGKTLAERSPHGPVWRPGSRQIAFDLYAPKQHDSISYPARDILSISSEGQTSVPTGLIVSPWNDFAPAFSPDGAKLAFISDRAGYMSIWVHHLVDQSWSQWSLEGDFPVIVEDAKLEWSPRGTDVLFSGKRIDGPESLYRLVL